MDRSLAALALLALVPLVACSSEPCDGVLCGACPEPVTVRVHLEGEGPVTVSELGCTASDPGIWICTGSLPVGTRTITIRAPGHADTSLAVTVGAPPPGCCACPVPFDDDVTLVPDAPTDGGLPDASTDAGATDGATPDAASATCNPGAVRFLPAGGSLEQGQLCDDVFVCVDDAAGAAAVMAASSKFVCSSEPEGPCSGTTCAYRDPGGPSTLDGDEIREICAVTLLTPTPEMECRVYL